MQSEAGSSSRDGALRRLRELDPRPPLWDRARLVERRCPFCGAAGAPFAERPDGLALRLCARCGAAFVSPAPGAEEVAGFYRGYRSRHRVAAFAGTPYADRLAVPSTARPERLARRIRARCALDDFRIQEVASMLALDGARVLDVGCGVGELLCALAALGAQVEGVDPDPEAVAFARQVLGLSGVREGSIEDVGRTQRFDLVVLQDVLEHVVAPRILLERGAELLAPGGLLYVWTPNASFAADEPEPLVLRGDYEHLQFASTRTVTYLAGELGLEPVHLECSGYLGSLEDAAHRPGACGASARGQRLRARLRGLPGVRLLSALRQALAGRHPERSGTYHLFALLRRPRC